MKKIIYLLITLLAIGASQLTHAIGDEELLPPEQAFSVKATAGNADSVSVVWTIANGYYIYKDKVAIESATPGVELGEPQFPKAKIKFTLKPDGTEGDVPVYYKTLKVDVPITRTDSNIKNIKLIAKSQGCADVGVCYPPLKQPVEVALAAAATSGKAGGFQALTDLGNSLGLGGGGEQEEFLPPDEAFKLTTEVVDGNTVVASWQVADRYYLYNEKFNVSVVEGDGVSIADVQYSKGKIKDDKVLNKTLEVHYNSAQAIIKLKRTNSAPQTIKLQIGSQGCAEAGICYPPQKKTVSFDLPAAGAVAAGSAASAGTTDTAAEVSSKTTLQEFIKYILIAFGTGMLLTFTPCVLPMVPILCSIIVGSGDKQPSKLRCGMLSLSYVMGTAASYTALGVAAGLAGIQLQAYFQLPWVLASFAAILALLSLSMFGFYQIQMPSAIQSRLQTKSQNLEGGSMTGTFIMGSLSALIVGACVGPLLIAVLGVAIQKGDPYLGGAMMFAMAMGMGVFLIMVGVGAGHLLPKAGGWMDNVKYVFGALLIGVSIYLLTGIPAVPVLLLWGIFFIVCGVYLGATQTLPEGASGWRYLWKGLGTAVLIWGVLSLLGGMQGNRDFMKPVDFSMMGGGGVSLGSSATVNAHDLFIHLKNTDELDSELAKAKAAGKAVLLDYYADWCTDCRRMEASTFSDPAIQDIMTNKMVALQVDVTDPGNDKTEAIKKRFKVFGPPAILLFDKNGKQRKDLDFYGFKSAAELKPILEQLL